MTPPQTGRRIAVLFVTSVPSAICDALAARGNDLVPQGIAFAPPHPRTVMRLLEAARPHGTPPDVFGSFLLQLELFFGVACAYDLREMSYLAWSLFPVYRGPIDRREASPAETALLARLAAPAFEEARRHMLHRDVERATSTRHLAGAARDADSVAAARSAPPPPSATVAAAAAAAATSPQSRRNALPNRSADPVLPYFSRILLLAAFVATHNPPETDTRYFSRRATGRRRVSNKTSAASARARTAAVLSGPRAFPLERLLALFRALVANMEGDADAAEAAAGDVGSQIAALCRQRLVTRVTAAAELDVPKFRCDMPAEMAERLAVGVGIDIAAYLHDPTM